MIMNILIDSCLINLIGSLSIWIPSVDSESVVISIWLINPSLSISSVDSILSIYEWIVLKNENPANW